MDYNHTNTDMVSPVYTDTYTNMVLYLYQTISILFDSFPNSDEVAIRACSCTFFGVKIIVRVAKLKYAMYVHGRYSLTNHVSLYQ